MVAVKRFEPGDRVRVIRDINLEDLYGENAGRKPERIITRKGSLGVVIDTHVQDNRPSEHVCVDFALSGIVGCWYIHRANLEKVEG